MRSLKIIPFPEGREFVEGRGVRGLLDCASGGTEGELLIAGLGEFADTSIPLCREAALGRPILG